MYGSLKTTSSELLNYLFYNIIVNHPSTCPILSYLDDLNGIFCKLYLLLGFS